MGISICLIPVNDVILIESNFDFGAFFGAVLRRREQIGLCDWNSV